MQGVILWVQNRPCDNRVAGDIRFAHIHGNWFEMRINRTEFIKLRVTKEEKEKMAEKAKSEGIPLSTLLRKSVLSETIRSNTDVQTVFQLKKIGNNLNQLAHNINMIPTDENIISSLKDIEILIHEIKMVTDKLVW